MPHRDPEARRRYHREYKRRNRWRYAPRGKVYDAAAHANARAARAGAPGLISPKDAAAVLATGRCHYCGSTAELGLDHVVPLGRGGANVIDNLVCACDGCNRSKWLGDRPGRWSRRVDRCRRYSRGDPPHLARDMCRPCYRQTWGSRAAIRERRQVLR